MPRTTIALEEGLLQELKERAAASRESMSRTVSRLLRMALDREREEELRRQAPLVWHVAEGAAPAPGFDPASRDYLDMLDEE